jgi:nicotinamide-nucleotide amidase
MMGERIAMKAQHTATDLATELGRALVARGWTLSGAESCTGGLLSHYITNVSGSSAYFVGTVVAYANRLKRDLVEVNEADLIAHGAVSAQVALAMARGARNALGTDIGYAVTGIAGPTGGTPQKPVGTVYIAVASPRGGRVEHHIWGADRAGNKQRSAEVALEMLLQELEVR